MSVVFASVRPGQRQVLAQGRLSERLTGRGLAGFDARLDYAHAGGRGRFPAVLAVRSGGWFALHLDPSRDMPALAGAGPVRLTLHVMRPGTPPHDVVLDVDGAGLAVTETEQIVAGQAMRVARIADAPFEFDIAFDPAPVLLDGLVLFDGDPEMPAAGVTVTIATLPDRVTDAGGRFRVPALPLAQEITLSFELGGTPAHHSLRPAWGAGTMTRTFPIPSP